MPLMKVTYTRQDDENIYSVNITEKQVQDIRVLPHINVISIEKAPPHSKRDYILK